MEHKTVQNKLGYRQHTHADQCKKYVQTEVRNFFYGFAFKGLKRGLQC